MPVASGVYSLIGVVVGAGATGGFQWWVAARKDSRDARAARRLVNRELTRMAFAIKSVSEQPQWTQSAKIQQGLTSHPSWDRYAEVLARELSKAEWSTLPVAYEMAEELAEFVSIAWGDAAAQKGNEVLIERARELVRRALEATKDRETELPYVAMGLGAGGLRVSIGTGSARAAAGDDEPAPDTST
jgi:hypothetical protein